MLTIKCLHTKDISNFTKHRRLIAAHHFFYSLVIICNLMVVCVYWTMIHHDTIDKYRGDGPFIRVVCQYTTHIVPAVVCVVNTALTRCVLLKKLLKPIAILMLTYVIINFVVTKLNKKPLYSFMHWETMETPMIVCGITITFSTFYLGLCHLDQMVKGITVSSK